MKFKKVLSLSLVSLAVTGCSTSVTTKQGHGNGGIPYYLPIPYIQVKEPIEVKRLEKLYAIIEIGGMTQYLYHIDGKKKTAIDELRKLILEPKNTLKFAPLPKELTVRTEKHTDTDETVIDATAEHVSKTDTKKNISTVKDTVITSSQTSNDLSYKPADVTKSYQVLLLPDMTQKYELFIESNGLISSDVNLTLNEGWNLTSIGVKSDSTATIAALSSVAGSLIGKQKDIRVAELSKSQVLELEKLKQQGVSAATGSVQAAAQAPTVVTYSIVGYTREVEISSIKPGLYSLHDPANVTFNYDSTTIWQPISF